MRYSGIQPQYFPRLHYFARALNTDFFVLRDEVQFVVRHKYPDGKNGPSYQSHTPIKTSAGLFLLNVPTLHQGLLPINQTGIAYNHAWVHRHLKTIQMAYSKSPNFAKIFPDIENLLTNKYQFLSEINIRSFLFGLNFLLENPLKLRELSIENINQLLKKTKNIRLKKIFLASEIKQLTKPKLSANEKILTIIKAVGANEDYTGGTAFQAYMNEDLFAENDIKVVVQDWRCREYPQLFERKIDFIPNLSIIDLLMNVSNSQALDIIRG